MAIRLSSCLGRGNGKLRWRSEILVKRTLQQFELDVEIAEIGFLQVGRIMREGGIEPVDQIACRGDTRRVARAALFQQGVGLGEIGRTRQIIGQEPPHPIDAQGILFDAREDLAGNARQMPDAFGDLGRADRTHGDFKADRQRLGIGQQAARELDLAARHAAGVQPLEQLARREQDDQPAARRRADDAGDPERHADADRQHRQQDRGRGPARDPVHS